MERHLVEQRCARPEGRRCAELADRLCRSVPFRPEEPECEQWPFRRPHRVYDVRWIVDQTADARFVPWVARLAPLSARQHNIDLLGRMTMVGILRMRGH